LVYICIFVFVIPAAATIRSIKPFAVADTENIYWLALLASISPVPAAAGMTKIYFINFYKNGECKIECVCLKRPFTFVQQLFRQSPFGALSFRRRPEQGQLKEQNAQHFDLINITHTARHIKIRPRRTRRSGTRNGSGHGPRKWPRSRWRNRQRRRRRRQTPTRTSPGGLLRR
jgi:hypothetical protein